MVWGGQLVKTMVVVFTRSRGWGERHAERVKSVCAGKQMYKTTKYCIYHHHLNQIDWLETRIIHNVNKTQQNRHEILFETFILLWDCLVRWQKSSISRERLTLYLMTFQVSSPSPLVSGETYIPFNSFMCGEPWHVESWNSWRATSSYFHSKQAPLKLSLPLLRLWTVASFQGHHLRALLIIWQVFSKINYDQLRSCNYAGWRDSVNLLQLHFQAQFSTYQDVNGEERLSSSLSDA